MIERREFITLLGGAAVAWPLAAGAQQGERVRRIGVLMAQERPGISDLLGCIPRGIAEAGMGRRPQHSNRLSLGRAR